jgi:hypothetical protein
LFAGAKVTSVATNFKQSLIKKKEEEEREARDVEVLIYLNYLKSRLAVFQEMQTSANNAERLLLLLLPLL